MKHRLTSLLVLVVLWSLPARSNQIILNEIMYHAFPAVPEDDGQEWIELRNKGTNAVSLNGWKFTKGISYTFTNVSIPAGGYLVVSADRVKFLTQYPGVTNVVGDWVGVLSNNGDEIQLSDQDGQVQDDVAYASQGDWGIRQRGPSDLSHFGWQWFTDADGLGKSLELINSELPNKYGQNWTASLTANGTPGRVNSVIASDIAPLILEAKHFPPVPLSTDAVTISAMVLDELGTGVTVTLFYRLDVNPQSIPFSSTNMFDDGAHGDGIAGDNFFAAILPPRPNNTVVEFYIQATDATGHTRTWPAPARQVYSTSPQNVGTFAQTANLLYQVDDNSYAGGQPIYHLVMTELERAELAQIWSSAANSDAAMNGTFVSTDGLASEVRYTAAYRNRGHGSRTSTPHNFRIEFPNDNRWHGVRNFNLNTQNTHAQVLGSALFQKTGLPMANSRPVQVRVNNSNLATPGPGPAGNGAYQFGSYAHNEELASEFAGRHFPTDSGGNVYRGIRSDSGAGYASLTYLGESKESYRGVYFKQNNSSEDDWSDLIGLTRAFTTNDATFVSSVKEVLDVDDAMLYFAVNTLTDNNETALSNGNGDDYAMYRGALDRRFRLLPYDTDSIFGLEGGSITASIFRMTNAAALGGQCVSGCGPANSASLYRMMTNAEFVPIYYRQLKRLIDTSFSSAQLGPLMDRALAGYVPQGIIDGYKSWSASRNAYVLSQIPLYLTNTTSLATSSGYFVSPNPAVALNGLANVIETRSVRVNGALANWAPIGGAWSISNVSLNPGINRVLVQAFGTNGLEVTRITIDIWYDDASVVNVSGTLASDTVWTAAAGPYNVTSTLTIPAGVTLTIAPGTSVYFASGAGMTVNGKLLASGNETNHIRFARVPGGANWGSLDFINTTVESRLSYVDFDSCAGTTIGGHNAQLHVNNSIVFIDHCTWPATPVVEFISFDASSFIVQNCVFPSYPAPTGPESLHGVNGIPTGGYGIFRDNYFGRTWGFNDTIDFTGGNRPGAILQIINNVFDGASDDCLDLDSTDAWIEGNIFLHVHRDPTRTDQAIDTGSAISGGVDVIGQNSDWTIINNLFYDVDHVFLNKGNSTTTGNGGGRVAFLYNTVAHVARESSGSTAAEIAAFDWSDDNIALPAPAIGSGLYAAYNILYDAAALQRFYNPTNLTVIFENNILPAEFKGTTNEWTGPGSGNQYIDPRLNLSVLAGKPVASVTAAQLRQAFQLLPGSPAIGAGFGGRDLGGLNPFGIAIAGEPEGTTAATSATLTVGPGGVFNWGATTPQPWGWTAFKWKLDGGAFSAEIAVTNPSPFTNLPTITLSNLSSGPHTVYVTGKNDAGYYQDDPFVYPPTAGVPAHLTASKTWIVNTAYSNLVINEVLARNVSAVISGENFPDMIELYNAGGGTINLSGMGVTDDPADRFKFTFPPGSTLGSQQYLVLLADNPNGTPGIHLGFNISASGGGLYLYNAGSNLVDSIVFGIQIADLSIGRLKNGAWGLTQPTFGTANVAQPFGETRKLKINEWLADGRTFFPDDFVELYNPDPLPVRLGGLYLSEAPQGSPNQNPIAPLSFIAGNGFMAFIADGKENLGTDHLNFKLSPNQGQIALLDSDLSVIDCVFYGVQSTDVSEGRQPSGSSQFAFFSQPTPGAPNPGVSEATVTNIVNNLVNFTNSWRFDATRVDRGNTWQVSNYDDSAWSQGRGLLLGVTTGNTPGSFFVPINTSINVGTTLPSAVYYRTHFTWNGNTNGTNLSLSHIVDDGAVYYLNGQEIYRYNMAAAPTAILFGTRATANISGDASVIGPISIPVSSYALVQGDNVLAVEVHQQNGTSTDVTMASSLDDSRRVTNTTTIQVVINEVLANNATKTNADGSITDWIELYNPTSNPIALADMSLTDDIANARRWVFPAGATINGNAYLLIRFDNSTPASTNNGGVLNTGFGLSADGSGVFLFDTLGRAGALLSGVTFGLQTPDYSIGRVPNGSGPWTLNLPTPGTQNTAVSLGNQSLLKVNEWMANPNSGSDWFEIYNPNIQPVSIGGLYLTDNLNNRTQYRIPALSYIGGGENGFVRFEADNPSSFKGANHVNFKLNNDGESIALYTANEALINSITFGVQTKDVSEGRFPDGSTNITAFPNTSTPAASNVRILTTIAINEVLTHTDGALEDAIEVQNISPSSIDISGWYLTDKKSDPRRFRIPDGTVIPAGGFMVFYENQFNPDFGIPPSFALSSANGDEVHLFTADLGGNLTGYRTSEKFGAAQNGISFGRYETSVGVDFTAMANRTFGADNPVDLAQFRTGTGRTNSYPKVGPIIINEIMFHPPDLISGLVTNDNSKDEFIELHNITGTNSPLYDPAYPTNKWRLTSGVDFTFADNASIPAGGYLVVVSFDPLTNATQLADFRATYGIDGGVTIVGPYLGKLDNGGESVELEKPDAPQPIGQTDAGFVPYVLADKVNYNDSLPWPSTADGTGNSLQRRVASDYGNDPVNWLAGTPTPGAATGSAGVPPPVITSLTPTHFVAQGANDSLIVTATGSALVYRWSLNGSLLAGATNSSLSITNAQVAAVGSYRVLVSNAGGSASATTFLDVQLPPVITQQPQSFLTAVGGKAIFTVAVSGSTPLFYQWKRDATVLTGATNSTLVITNVQGVDEGNYSVLVSNQYGQAPSALAALTLNAAPAIITQPQSTNVFVGATASFNVVAAGSLPLRYQWRFNNNPIPNQTNATLTLNNVQLTNGGSYSVMVTNLVGSIPSAGATLTVTVPPVVTITATDSVASEPGANTGTFTIFRSGNISLPLTVNFAVGGSALAGNDYVALSSPVTIPAGSASTILIVTPLDDATLEGNETVIVTLTSGVDYVIGSPNNATVVIFDNDNVAPSISITNPIGGTVFTAPVNVQIGATATDVDGTIAKVEFFYRGTNKLGEVTSAPFVLTWTNALPGTNILTAVATDNLGSTAVSAPVSIVVNVLPAVSITSPANGATFTTPANISITASATDSDGISQVEFYSGTNLLGTRLSTPYTVQFTNVPVGSYSLTARATDGRGAVSISSAVTVTVNVPIAGFGDDFINRGVLVGYTNFITGNNSSYTRETGEPRHDNKNGTHSGWLSWTAPVSGVCAVDTIGSSFDTVLAIYTGTALTNLVIVASNDDADGNTLQSQLSFNAVAGTVYQIAVDGYNSVSFGSITFRMSLPNPNPFITTQPQSLIVNQGTSPTFTVVAGGPAPLRYQWAFNGTNLSNGTNTSLALTSVRGTNDGVYVVVVSNNSGSVTSAPVTLTVRLQPTISSQPQSLVANPGSSATFSVSATGTATLLYQWRFDTLDISGATNSSFTRSDVQYTNGGSYSVTIANSVGIILSQSAELIVRPRIVGWQVTSNGAFNVTLNGTPGKGYAIEGTPNLTNWTNVGGVTNTAVQSQYTDQGATTNSTRMYRARVLP